MYAQYWETAAAVLRDAPLEDDGKLVWLAAPTYKDELGELVSMSLDTARTLRDALTAVLNEAEGRTLPPTD